MGREETWACLNWERTLRPSLEAGEGSGRTSQGCFHPVETESLFSCLRNRDNAAYLMVRHLAQGLAQGRPWGNVSKSKASKLAALL